MHFFIACELNNVPQTVQQLASYRAVTVGYGVSVHLHVTSLNLQIVCFLSVDIQLYIIVVW